MTRQPGTIRAKHLAQKHLAALEAGARATWGAASLALVAGEFIMSNPTTGTHRLAQVGTDHGRLAAHWRGFVQTMEARAAGQAGAA